MRIITRGPIDPITRFTCPNCKSVIEARQSEGELRTAPNDSAYVFRCPVCTKDVWVDPSRFRA